MWKKEILVQILERIHEIEKLCCCITLNESKELINLSKSFQENLNHAKENLLEIFLNLDK